MDPITKFLGAKLLVKQAEEVLQEATTELLKGVKEGSVDLNDLGQEEEDDE